MAVEGRFLAAEALQQLRLHGFRGHAPEQALLQSPQLASCKESGKGAVNPSQAGMKSFPPGFSLASSPTLLRSSPRSQTRSLSSSVRNEAGESVKTVAGYWQESFCHGSFQSAALPKRDELCLLPQSEGCNGGSSSASASEGTYNNASLKSQPGQLPQCSNHAVSAPQAEEKKEGQKKTLLFPEDRGSFHLTPLDLSPSSTDEGRGGGGEGGGDAGGEGRVGCRLSLPPDFFLPEPYHQRTDLFSQYKIEGSSRPRYHTVDTAEGTGEALKEGSAQRGGGLSCAFSADQIEEENKKKKNGEGITALRHLIRFARAFLSKDIKDVPDGDSDLRPSTGPETNSRVVCMEERKAFFSRAPPANETWRGGEEERRGAGEGEVFIAPSDSHAMVERREIAWVLEALLVRRTGDYKCVNKEREMQTRFIRPSVSMQGAATAPHTDIICLCVGDVLLPRCACVSRPSEDSQR